MGGPLRAHGQGPTAAEVLARAGRRRGACRAGAPLGVRTPSVPLTRAAGLRAADFEEIAATLAQVGAAARAARQRLTCHPSHYVQLATPDERLRARSMRHLELNARVFDLMGYPPSHHNKINIHVGGAYGCKAAALDRFARAVGQLSHSCRARLTGEGPRPAAASMREMAVAAPMCRPMSGVEASTAAACPAAHPTLPPTPHAAVENDDRVGYFSIADLLPLHAASGVPLVFDYLHHALLPDGLSEEEALLAALATWPAGLRPVVHYRCVERVGSTAALRGSGEAAPAVAGALSPQARPAPSLTWNASCSHMQPKHPGCPCQPGAPRLLVSLPVQRAQ